MLPRRASVDATFRLAGSPLRTTPGEPVGRCFRHYRTLLSVTVAVGCSGMVSVAPLHTSASA